MSNLFFSMDEKDLGEADTCELRAVRCVSDLYQAQNCVNREGQGASRARQFLHFSFTNQSIP